MKEYRVTCEYVLVKFSTVTAENEKAAMEKAYAEAYIEFDGEIISPNSILNVEEDDN